MKKILLQINSVINSGSTGRIAEEIGNIAMDNNWESYIAYGRNERESESIRIKIGSKFDILYHVLITRIFDRHGLASKRATRKLLKEIGDIKPDIIHLHNIHGYYLNYKLLFEYLARKNIPTIWTLHDCWSFTGHCAYFDYVKCKKWETVCSRCPQKKSYPKNILFTRSKKNFYDKKDAFNHIDNLTIVPVSSWLENLSKRSFLRKYPILKIHNGINTDTFKYDCKSNAFVEKYNLIRFKKIVLGVASIWDQRKGFQDFIQLRNFLSDEYGIILVGLTDKQIKEIPDRFVGIARTESVDELAQLYSLADVFVNPTWEDNFPTTNLEAMACGTPVVTYRTGGSIEAISEATGLIVEQGDHRGLANAVETICNKGRDYYSDNCRQRVLDKFKKEDRYQDYINLYENILKSKD
ncbi:MAG: glycosyltransferase [Bacteroidales bacterium]